MKKDKKQKIMIMGAGIYQVPLIKKAKEMGLDTIVVSIPGNYPGIELADVFLPYDTRDKEGILKSAIELEIDGICTSGTDVAVQTIGYVNEHMHLSGVSYEASKKVTDKLLMKEAFSKANVSTAGFRKVFSFEEAKYAANTIGYPVIVKIVDSSGSRGVIKAADLQSLEKAYEEARKITRKEYLLIEEYIEADEIGVDGYVGEQNLEVFLPHAKYTYTVDGVTVPMGHSFPYDADAKLMEELRVQISMAVHALGLKNCPFNADVFVRNDKVWIIEVGGRTGATCIPELISIHNGYDWYEKLIRAAMGENIDFTSREANPCIAKLLFSDKKGTIKAVDDTVLEELKKKGITVCLDYSIGDQIDTMRNATDRIGHIIMESDTEEVIDQYLQMVRDAIVVTA